jgi:hypothetical protein
MLDRQAFALRLPHQRTFIAFDCKQVALCLGLTPLPLLMAQASGVVGLRVYLAVERT